MLQSILQFAHEESLHDESTSQLVHNLTNTPVAIGLYIAGLGLIWFLSRKAKNPQATVVFASLAYNFVLGVVGYIFVPWVAVIAITLGILTALVVTLSSLAGQN